MRDPGMELAWLGSLISGTAERETYLDVEPQGKPETLNRERERETP